MRILGEVHLEYAELLRKADHIFIEELRAQGLYDKVSQAFAVFLPGRINASCILQACNSRGCTNSNTVLVSG